MGPAVQRAHVQLAYAGMGTQLRCAHRLLTAVTTEIVLMGSVLVTLVGAAQSVLSQQVSVNGSFRYLMCCYECWPC